MASASKYALDTSDEGASGVMVGENGSFDITRQQPMRVKAVPHPSAHVHSVTLCVLLCSCKRR